LTPARLLVTLVTLVTFVTLVTLVTVVLVHVMASEAFGVGRRSRIVIAT
jgi:hypothetical protein